MRSYLSPTSAAPTGPATAPEPARIVREVLREADEDGAADEVAEGDGQQVAPQEVADGGFGSDH